MSNRLISVLIACFMLAGTAVADEFRDYYPRAGAQRTGSLDAVDHQRQAIVINDIKYTMSSNLIVHSTTTYSVPASRLRSGLKIGYKTSTNGRLVMEIWLLPNDYKGRGR